MLCVRLCVCLSGSVCLCVCSICSPMCEESQIHDVQRAEENVKCPSVSLSDFPLRPGAKLTTSKPIAPTVFVLIALGTWGHAWTFVWVLGIWSLCSKCSYSLSCHFQLHIVLFYRFASWVSAFLITMTKCLTKAVWGKKDLFEFSLRFSPLWWERSSSRSEAAAAHTVSQIRKQW